MSPKKISFASPLHKLGQLSPYRRTGKKDKFTFFPCEIWQRIMPHVQDTPTLASLCLASYELNLMATPFLYETVRLKTPKALTRWLTTPKEERSEGMQKTKHLEIHFDLKYLRNNNELRDVLFDIWVRRSLRPNKDHLDSVYLTTSGFEFFKEEPNESSTERAKELGYKFVTLSHAVDRLLTIMVGREMGPLHFRWVSAPPPQSQGLSWRESQDQLMPLPASSPLFHFESIGGKLRESLEETRHGIQQKYNAWNRNQFFNFPRTPPIICDWPRVRTLELPFLMRPAWHLPATLPSDEIKERRLEYFSIPACSLHKWMKSYDWETLLSEIIKVNPYDRIFGSQEQQKVIFELRGRVKKGREDFLYEFQNSLMVRDRNEVVKDIYVVERSEDAQSWRERIMSDFPSGP
ncbi:hypothetical protein IAU59_003269 [Kwoniella sp. CBS 9459]